MSIFGLLRLVRQADFGLNRWITGTSLMKIHMKSIICAKPPALKKRGIDQLLRDMVSLPLVIKKPYLYFNSL